MGWETPAREDGCRGDVALLSKHLLVSGVGGERETPVLALAAAVVVLPVVSDAAAHSKPSWVESVHSVVALTGQQRSLSRAKGEVKTRSVWHFGGTPHWEGGSWWCPCP